MEHEIHYRKACFEFFIRTSVQHVWVQRAITGHTCLDIVPGSDLVDVQQNMNERINVAKFCTQGIVQHF